MRTITKVLDILRSNALKEKIIKHLNRARNLFFLDGDLKSYKINELTYKRLKKKYSYVLDRKLNELPREHSDKVWTCWFQGMENAPLLCQVGYQRMKQVVGEENVFVITAENYAEYIDLPEYIVRKWKQGIISNVHISDIARYCLLYQYGGTWIDSTILILDSQLPEYMRDSKLFLFADHITGLYPNIQSSFINAYSHSPLIAYVHELIFEYWKNENYTIDYNMYHFFFQMAEERCKEEWNDVYRYPNHATHILRKYMFEKYDQKRYEQIKSVCPVQKLSHKKKQDGDISDTFYDRLIIHSSDFFAQK